MTGDKGFHTFDELVELLSRRGVAVDQHTKTVLKRESYYSVVNGYKDLFIDKALSAAAGEDRYKPGTSFDEIYRLYCLDRELRAVFLSPLLIAETTLKTLTVHVFCEKFRERDSYLDPANYDLRDRRAPAVRKVVASLDKALRVEGERHKKDFIEHYRMKHKHVPLWVLANFLTFGVMSKFYDAQRESTQSAVCRELFEYALDVRGAEGTRVEPRLLGLMFRYMSDLRNICAHEERLYCVGLGKSKDIRIRQTLPYFEAVLSPVEYRRLCANLRRLFRRRAGDFITISIDEVLDGMGFESLVALEEVLGG